MLGRTFLRVTIESTLPETSAIQNAVLESYALPKIIQEVPTMMMPMVPLLMTAMAMMVVSVKAVAAMVI